jgi:hypothetical protein
MADRRGSRFVVEALFLVALAVALALARLDALEIVGAMFLGWIVVAAIEWAAWRSEPHYGSGLPPRYYVPAVNLPPPQPLEQVGRGYPGGAREEAPTWIASAALRAEVLGEWPVAAVPVEEEEEDGGDPWTVAALPPAPAEEVPDAVPVPDAPEPSPVRTARHTLDPLGDPAPRRRFGRGRTLESGGVVEVAARPAGPRPLPGGAGRA